MLLETVAAGLAQALASRWGTRSPDTRRDAEALRDAITRAAKATDADPGLRATFGRYDITPGFFEHEGADEIAKLLLAGAGPDARKLAGAASSDPGMAAALVDAFDAFLKNLVVALSSYELFRRRLAEVEATRGQSAADPDPDADFIVGRSPDDRDRVFGLHLIFESDWHVPDSRLPASFHSRPGHWGWVRPVEVGVVMTTIEEIYLASIRHDLPPPDYRERTDWAASADPRSLTLRVDALRMGSPLHVLLDVPATVYVPTFAAFAYGLARVLGAPYRAIGRFERARESYFEQRVATAEAKDAWLDYKAERVARQTRLRLRAVDDYAALPGEDVEQPIEPSRE